MIGENALDKSRLVSELKETHIELVEVYKNIFDYKYRMDKDFKTFIDGEHKENRIKDKEKQAWNDNFCHRASYTLLNKILFIRICEDKGFMLNPEDYIAGEPKDPHIGEKLSKKGLQKWANLVTNYTLGELVKLAFLDMKKSYTNIILYKDDRYEILNPTTEELGLKYLEGNQESKKFVLQFEKILDSIVDKLDTNRFDFKNADGNILGDVYEKFMDRDTRKAIGQFYTPEFVIEYILKNTVADADVVENPFVSVADISCGSGHFLIMAYDILRDKFTNNLELLRDKYANETYTVKRHGKVEQLTGREYWKEENVHYHLLKHCIYGADIDSFAVQLTTINLLLKDLDNFTDELNIIECDSLIKWEEDYDWRDLKRQLEDISMLYTVKYRDINGVEHVEEIGGEKAREIVNLCEFWDKKYDYVVGNPPYVNVYSLNSKKRDIYSNQNYNFMYMKYDLYILFYERAFSKLKSCGILGFIVPYSFNNQRYGQKLRKWLLKNTCIEHIVDYSDIIVFDAMVTGCTYIFRNSFKNDNQIKITRIKDEISYFIRQDLFLETPDCMFRIELTEISFNIIEKMKKNAKRIEDFCYVSMGAEIHSKEDATNRVTKDQRIVDRQVNENYKPFLEGLDIGKYKINNVEKYIKYIPDIMRRPKFPELFENEKLLIRNVTGKSGIIATIDLDHYYVDCTINCCVLGNKLKGVKRRVLQRKEFINKEFEDIELLTLLAILNSKSTNYYFLKYLGDNLHVNPNDIKSLLVPRISEEIQGYLYDCVERIMELEIKRINIKGKLYDIIFDNNDLGFFVDMVNNIDIVDKDINIIMNKIDWVLYKIYNFNTSEIAEIEMYYNNVMKQDYIIKTILMYSNIDINTVLNSDPATDILNRCVLIDLIEKDLSIDLFINEYINNQLTLGQIADMYGYSLTTLFGLKNRYNKKIAVSKKEINIINTRYISDAATKRIIDFCYIYMYKHTGMVDITTLNMILKDNIRNFTTIMGVFRAGNISLKTIDVIKSLLNNNSYTWLTYRKAKKSGKINKTFIKYYDTNYYGLAEWSDEIHKNYFLDAIEEYTTNNPNEKKARDILKLFEDLEIEDKKDYIEVIQEKIKTTFR